MAKSTHGGKREGAGRKPSPNPMTERRTAFFTDAQIEYLESLGPDFSKALRKVIDEHQAELNPPRVGYAQS